MKYLFLSPHPDDVELTCGGTIARLTDEGHEVVIAVFSDCSIDLNEMYQAHQLLKVTTIFYDYPRREFDQHRQEILDTLIRLRSQLRPDVVFMPDQSDIHQDHQVIGMEGIRAFKLYADLISFAHSHNQVESDHNLYIKLFRTHIEAKIKALLCYSSQLNRFYFQPIAVESVMRYYGVQCDCEYAEAFRIIRKLN